jgi:hypothetical protein
MDQAVNLDTLCLDTLCSVWMAGDFAVLTSTETTPTGQVAFVTTKA